MSTYKCTKCDKNHILHYSMKSPTPESVIDTGENVLLMDDNNLCILAVLKIPIHDIDEYFEWFAWVRIGKEDFLKNVNIKTNHIKNTQYKYQVKLLSANPFLEISEGIMLIMKHTETDELPELKFDKTNPNLLDLQLNGMSKEYYLNQICKLYNNQVTTSAT